MKQIELAKEFARLVKGRGSQLSELLADDVHFATHNINVQGRNNVLQRLLGDDTGRNYREATWVDAKPNGESVQITARMPDAALHAGYTLLLKFNNGRLQSIRQQNLLPARQPPIEPLHVTDELARLVNKALSSGHPMLLAHVDENGQPALSFRGSTQAFSDHQLAIWVRNGAGGLIRSIEKNPKVALMYRDEEKKATFQFQGRARITTDENERQKIYQAAHKVEQDHDFAGAGVALIIDLERIDGYAGLTPAGPVGRVNMRR